MTGYYKDQLSLTNPSDELHHGERAVLQTNKVDAQCDKLATDRTKLTTLGVENRQFSATIF